MDGRTAEPTSTDTPGMHPEISSSSARRLVREAATQEPLRADAGIARAGAASLDATIACGLGLLTASRLPVESSLIRWLIAVAVFLAYYALQEACWGRTLFKALLGLRVVADTGLRASVGQVLVRTLLRLVEANPVVLGFMPGAVAILVSRSNQRIGDRLAGTLVIRSRPSR